MSTTGTVITGPAIEQARQLDAEVLDERGLLRLLPVAFWRSLPLDVVRAWAHFRGTYGIPTVEIIDWLRARIAGRTAIEIGAGHGDFARFLGIPATDSRIQETPQFRFLYSAIGQPPITYPAHVERLDAAAAVAAYRPQVVIGSWVTQRFIPGLDRAGDAQAFEHGIDELALWAEPCVESYLVIGNMNVHGRKRLRRETHTIASPPGLFSRASDPAQNCVFVWHKTPPSDTSPCHQTPPH